MKKTQLNKLIREEVSKALKEQLDSFKPDGGNGIHITGFNIGDIYLTLDPKEHEEILAEPVTTNQGVIDVNGQKLYYSVGAE